MIASRHLRCGMSLAFYFGGENKRRSAMAKSGLIIPLALAIASGCALFDGPESELEKSALLIPAVESSAPTNLPGASSTPIETVALPSLKKISVDDIRRLQARLRAVGLDPGPVDGAAGAKTKAAFARLEAGCGQIQSHLDALRDSASAGPTLRKFTSRQEIFDLQTQLRAAGFDPGPADGVMGTKTKLVVTHIYQGCQSAPEFALQWDRLAVVTNQSAALAPMPQRPSATQIIPAQSRAEVAKQLAASTAVRPQEEIRILQLRLRDAGFDPGPFDGVMGPKTKLALQQMQAKERSGKSKNAITASIVGQY
jgi:peptidoglycan hydrolase-like protein with peptidoglycan-binding domain